MFQRFETDEEACAAIVAAEIGARALSPVALYTVTRRRRIRVTDASGTRTSPRLSRVARVSVVVFLPRRGGSAP